MLFRLGLFALTLSACTPADEVDEQLPPDEEVTEEAEEAPPALEQCDAADYRVFEGTPIADVEVSEDPSIRVFTEGDIITQEYLPQRTNIVLDASGAILNVYCG
ncbi:MAG: I78 family peptidase inhibitor [Boseongicola sp.]|nr:I78 family peptidase inhibitor [Boseongicola sp.]MDD9976131.1 I78 family peptidase inhibitor [Boseongicola sp.]